jgi:polyisoprenoid-binding protein YceI
MLRVIFTFCALFWIVFGFAQKDSSIEFVIKNLGINVDGHFNKFEIKTDFDASTNLTFVAGEIYVSSIETGIESRDEHLLKDDYFDAKNYPKISLKSNAITKKGLSDYQVSAILTIKDISKEIKVPIRVETLNDTYKVESSFEINRKDFDIGGSSFVMSKTVKIKVLHFESIE